MVGWPVRRAAAVVVTSLHTSRYCLLAGGPLSENCAQPKKQTFSKKNGRATHGVLGPVLTFKISSNQEKGPFPKILMKYKIQFYPLLWLQNPTESFFQKLLGFSTIFRNKFFSFLKNHKWVIASAKIKQPIQLANPEINRVLEKKNFQTF